MSTNLKTVNDLAEALSAIDGEKLVYIHTIPGSVPSAGFQVNDFSDGILISNLMFHCVDYTTESIGDRLSIVTVPEDETEENGANLSIDPAPELEEKTYTL